jgi:AraC family transcriptional regulator
VEQAVTKLSAGQLYGSVLRSSAVSGFKLIETAYAPCVEIPRHFHESAYLCLVLQGNYTETYGRHLRVCKPSTLIFHPPDESHSDSFHHGGGRCFNIQVSLPWLNRVREYSMVMDSPAEYYGGALANLAMKLYREFRLLDEVSPLAVEGLMLEIAAEASRRKRPLSGTKIPPRIEMAKDFISAYFNRPLALKQIAESVEAHPVYLAREFHKHYHCTIGEYVRRLRVESACQRLSDSDEPLSNIALAVGFSDQSHFSRTFKRLTGMTPAKYRKARRHS